MTITRFSTGAIRDNALATNVSFAASDMELIGTVRVGSGGVASVTFSNIPQEYKHLQLRGTVSTSSTGVNPIMRFNSDSGTNYNAHQLYGDGSGTGSFSFGGSQTGMGFTYSISDTSIFSGTISDIFDYSSANKYKTVRSIGGRDRNGSGYSSLYSGFWMNVSAVNSIGLFASSGNFTQFTRFSLYGVRG